MAVSKRLRFEILRRDGHRCRYCGRGVNDMIITVDHVTPTALGGTDLPDNLVAACEDCNAGKTSTIPDGPTITGVADDAVRWARAIKLAAAELEQREQPKHDYRAAFKAAWEHWGYDSGGKRVTFALDPEWATTMDRFREAGLPVTVWPDIVETAMTSRAKLDNRFRYCCGIAWRMVTEMQERAKEIIKAPSDDGAPTSNLDTVAQAVVDAWAEGWGPGEPGESERAEFRASMVAFRERGDETEVQDLFEATRYGAWFGATSIDRCLTLHYLELRETAIREWSNSWAAASGAFPDDIHDERVGKQYDALREANVSLYRIQRAAVFAGAHLSTELHFGLRDDELTTGAFNVWSVRTRELWSAAYRAAARRWPSQEELEAFGASVGRVVASDGDFYTDDLFIAASAAGAYQDPDLTTCLPRHLSVFEIAARPLTSA